MYGYIPEARGKTDGYQQVYTLPDFWLLFQVSGYGYAVGYTALLHRSDARERGARGIFERNKSDAGSPADDIMAEACQ